MRSGKKLLTYYWKPCVTKRLIKFKTSWMLIRKTLWVITAFCEIYFPALCRDIIPQHPHKIQKAIGNITSGVADNETRFDRRGDFCWRGGNTKMSKWLPQRCSPRQSWPLRRGGFLREGEGGAFWGGSSEMSVWLRVRNVFFWRPVGPHRNGEASPLDVDTWMLPLVCSWLSTVSEPEVRANVWPTYFDTHPRTVRGHRRWAVLSFKVHLNYPKDDLNVCF